MNTNSRIATSLAAGVASILLVACGSQMQPARAALDRIETTVNASAADAGKYAPGQLQNVQQSLTELKGYYDRKEYDVVLARAPAVFADANSMVTIAARKKSVAMSALATDWSGISASLPPLIAAVKARLDADSRHPVRGIDQRAARENLDDAVSAWDKAQSAYKAGALDEAVSVAHAAETEVRSAASTLKLPLPAKA